MSNLRHAVAELNDAVIVIEGDRGLELAQLLDREKKRVLVMAAGRPPVILERLLYYQDEMFAGMFDS